MYTCTHIYIYIYTDTHIHVYRDIFSRTVCCPRVRPVRAVRPISLLRFWVSWVWLNQNLNSTGWNSHIQWEWSGNLESTNLSRDNLSREIGRKNLELWGEVFQHAGGSPGNLTRRILVCGVDFGRKPGLRWTICLWGNMPTDMFIAHPPNKYLCQVLANIVWSMQVGAVAKPAAS